MLEKPSAPSAEAYLASTNSAVSLSLNALYSGFPYGPRPVLWAASETIASPFAGPAPQIAQHPQGRTAQFF